MTNVIATPPSVTAVNSSGSTTAVALLDANPALAALDPGSLVKGVVVGRDPHGQTVLETEFGQVTLTARIALAVGSDVVLQIQSVGSRLNAIILSVDNQPVGNLGRLSSLPLPPAPATGSRPAGIGQPAPSGAAAPPIAEVILSTGAVVTATVLRSAAGLPAAAATSTETPAGQPPGPPPSASAGASTTPRGAPASSAASAPETLGAAAAPPGSRFPVRVIGIVPPAASATGAPGIEPSIIAPPAAATAAGPSATATGAPAASEPGLPAPLGAPPPAAARPQAPLPPSLQGIVLGSNTGGQVEVRTPLGIIELPLATEPPVGTIILLEPLALPKLSTPAGQTATATPTEAVVTLAQEWPALRQALDTLQAATGPSAEAAHAALAATLPRLGPQLALGLLAFASILERNGAEGWLDAKTLQQLGQAGLGGLAAQLRDDAGRLGRFAADPGPGDWRSFFLPLYDGRNLSQVRFYLRRHAQGQAQAPAGQPEQAGRRFVVELELSRLGTLQIDGFLKERRLNLMLRSHRLLHASLREALSAIFGAATEAAGLTGSLGFQDNLAKFPIAPLEAVRGKAEAVVV
jgi:hypothetical protein